MAWHYASLLADRTNKIHCYVMMTELHRIEQLGTRTKRRTNEEEEKETREPTEREHI